MTATTWEKALELAADRPLVELRLTAPNPSIAAGLIGLAQPLGADSLKFYVNVSGTIRDGGEMSFSASDVKPNHPTRPLTMAQTIFNALAEGPFHPLDGDWGARVACYGLVAAGLRNPDRLHRAAVNLHHADGAEAAWWLGLMARPTGKRAVRALRILVEAVR